MSITGTSWTKGESGNPKGRPLKGFSITETISEMFGGDTKLKQKLAKVIIDKAISGDLSAIKLLMAYTDGLPIQSTDFTSGNKPLPIPIMGGLSIYTGVDYVKSKLDKQGLE